MRISVLTISSHGRVGDAAIAQSAITLLRNSFPQSRILCHTSLSGEDLDRVEEKLFSYLDCWRLHPALLPQGALIKDEVRQASLKLAFYTLRAIILLALYVIIGNTAKLILHNDKERQAFEDLVSADLVVSIGGTYLVNYRHGFKGLLKTFVKLFPVIISIISRRKVVVLGASIGPVEGMWARYLTRWTLSKICRFFVRESSSIRILEDLGEPKATRIALIPDLAFYNDKIECPPALDDTWFESETRVLGAVIRDYDFPESNHPCEQRQRYFKTIAELLDYAIESTGGRVVFLQHCTELPDKDSIAIEAILKYMRNRSKTLLLSNLYSPPQLRYIYERLDFLVSSRLHGLLLSHLPAIGIACDGVKMFGTMKILGLSDYVVDANSMSFPELKEKFDRAWAKRHEILANRLRRSAELRRSFDAVVEHLRDCLKPL
jgi:polysaccharide pyruvyl transferase WcaK-like protein